ncbi:MAG: hypothetical protein ACT4QE_26125 [Anaerolineales bacterium]
MTPLPSSPFGLIAHTAQEWFSNAFLFAAINMLWVLSWFTVVLGPPATFGMYYVAHRLAREQTISLGDLWIGLRRYFVKSWIWMLFNLVVALTVWINISFYSQFGGVWWATLLQGVFVSFGAGWAMMQFFAVPYVLELKDESFRTGLRNSAYTFLASPAYALTLIVLAGLVLAGGVALVGPLLLGAASFIALLGAFAVRERVAHYRKAVDGPSS